MTDERIAVDLFGEPDVKQSRPTVFIPIPPGSIARPCKYNCGALIYLAPHPSTGNPHPVEVTHAQSFLPTHDTFGQGTTHYASCEPYHKLARARRRTPHDAREAHK